MNCTQQRQFLCYFAVAIIASSICLSSAANRNRLYGPMVGKRSNDELNDLMGFLTDTEQKDATRAEDLNKEFAHPERTCWLDSAYSRLSPEWQEIVYKIFTMAEGKRSQ